MKKKFLQIFILFLLSACVANQTIQTVQTGDFEMNCAPPPKIRNLKKLNKLEIYFIDCKSSKKIFYIS